jgi:hypothetical protein
MSNRIPDSAMPRDYVLPRLAQVVERESNSWSAICPARHDTRPSCSIIETSEGNLPVHCHAHKCSVKAICAALGLTVAHLYATPYALRCRKR